MGYYIRVLGTTDVPLPIDTLRTCLPVDFGVELSGRGSNQAVWLESTLRHKDGTEIAIIERNPVIPGELGADEIGEFVNEVGNAQPASASKWLLHYLPKVAVIYAFQLLSGTDIKGGWNAVHALQSYIWKQVGGILQADSEGFSNELGQHILWQFNDNVDGEYDMAVLDHDEKWVAFTMNVGDREHRQSFLDGRVPLGVTKKLITPVTR
jgi:hypothetical protein